MLRKFINARSGLDGQPIEFAVENGRFVSPTAAGEIVDLLGKWVLPGLIDAHCHVLPAGLDLQKLNLGHCSDRSQVLDAVRDWERGLEPGKWLLAVHYDQNKFPDGRHLTRHDLDAVSSERPILLRHVNGHASIANSAALRRAKIELHAADLPGGEFGRDSNGQLNGVAFEDAHELVNAAVPNPTLEEMVDAIQRACGLMAGRGILCASDMMTGRFDLQTELEAYRIVAERGSPVRIRLYVLWGQVFGGRGIGVKALREADLRFEPASCRIGGIKIFADGAIGSATAAIYGAYSGDRTAGHVLSKRAQTAAADAPEGVEVSGQLIYAPSRLREMVRIAATEGYQVAIHTIGDYSTDLVMGAYEQLEDASKHRIEHAMLLSDGQIDRMARLGAFCTMQPEFLHRFGHTYLRQLGPERAAKLERMRSVQDAGIPLSLSSDMPITSGDPWIGMDAAVNRPSGFDPSEALTYEEALFGYSRAGAQANLDRDMGEIAPGYCADFLVFNNDPSQLKHAPAQVFSGGKEWNPKSESGV